MVAGQIPRLESLSWRVSHFAIALGICKPYGFEDGQFVGPFGLQVRLGPGLKVASCVNSCGESQMYTSMSLYGCKPAADLELKLHCLALRP